MQSPKSKKTEKNSQADVTRTTKRDEVLFLIFSVIFALVGVGILFLLLGKPGQPSQASPLDNLNALKLYVLKMHKGQQEKASLGDVKVSLMKSASARDKDAYETTRFAGNDPIMMKVTFVNPKDKKLLTVDIYHKVQNGEQKVRTVTIPAYQKGDRYLSIAQTAQKMEKGNYVVKFSISDVPLFEKNFSIE